MIVFKFLVYKFMVYKFKLAIVSDNYYWLFVRGTFFLKTR